MRIGGPGCFIERLQRKETDYEKFEKYASI